MILAGATAMISSAAVPGDTADYSVTGKITYKSGTVVKMQVVSGDTYPVAGLEGELSKSFETELFGGKVSGWMSIGQMKVTAIAKDIITFTLLKELSVVTENGVKKNHFEIGKEVKFVWKVAVSPDEAAYQRGQEAVDDEDYVAAYNHYRQAYILNPSNDKALNMLGMIKDFQEDMDSALIWFKLANEAKPAELRYARNVLITAYKTGDHATAYTYAVKALELDKADAELWYFRALTLYAWKSSDLPETDRAAILSDMNKALELEPTNSKYYSERAYLKYDFGDAAGACADIRKAKELGYVDADEDIKKYCGE